MNGIRKFTLQEIKHKLKEINPNIEIIADEYINKDAKLRCKCLIDGYEWDARWGHLTRGTGCPKCAGQVLTLEDIKNKLKIMSPTIQILSNEYNNASSKLKCRCLVDTCNNEWETTWMSLCQGSLCPECGFLKTGDSKRLSLDEIKESLKLINPNIKILSEEYKNSKETRLKCKCLVNDCMNEWNTTWNSLSKGNGCPKCGVKKASDKRRLSIEDIKEKLKIISPITRIISDEYKTNMTKLKCICDICGHKWTTDWVTLSQGVSCYKCERMSRRGVNHSNWKGGVTPLDNFLRGRMVEWRNYSIKNCNYKCIITGMKFDHVHHVYSFDLILDEILKISKLPFYYKVNQYTDRELDLLVDLCTKLHIKYGLGVCLTEETHYKFHEIYGQGNNTPKQFEEFRTLMVNEEYNGI